jgi:lipopolysaccharide transport system ATP-binding protein
VDEVLAVGDAAFQKKCLTKMVEVARAGQTVLFVSHNLDAVLTLCSRSIVLTKGRVDFDGAPQDAIAYYHRTLCALGGGLDESVIYQEGPGVRPQLPRVTRVEVVQPDGEPASLLTTWDDVMFRIHYVSDKTIPDGSIVMDIRDYKEQRLIVLDSGAKLGILAGSHFVDCHVRKLPLPSGEYFLTIGITNPFVDWLWRGFSIGALRVNSLNSRDIYQIGRPPAYARMTIAADYFYNHNHAPSTTLPANGVGAASHAHPERDRRSSTRQLA